MIYTSISGKWFTVISFAGAHRLVLFLFSEFYAGVNILAQNDKLFPDGILPKP